MEQGHRLETDMENSKAISPEKPVFFKVLLVLSGLNAVFSLVFAPISAIVLSNPENHDVIRTTYKSLLAAPSGAVTDEDIESSIAYLLEVGSTLAWYTTAMGALLLIAVMLMKKLKKMGYHLYVGQQFLSVLGGYFLFSTQNTSFPLFGVILSLFFIVNYRRFYALMD